MQPMQLITMLPEDVDIVYYDDESGRDSSQNVEHLFRDGVEFVESAISHVAFPAEIIEPQDAWLIYDNGSRQTVVDVARTGLLNDCGAIVKVEGIER